jgi:hypothetical protein
MLWGITPTGLREVGWLPMTTPLATKIQQYNETGIPTSAPTVSLRLRSGETPVIYRDRTTQMGAQVRCKSCNHTWLSDAPPKTCPGCGVQPDLNKEGKLVSPFNIIQAAWQQVTYVLGAGDRVLLKFDRKGVISE